MELLTKLGVNWQLLLAQIVNFAILLGVLSYFLYRPFLDLLDRRRERVRLAMEGASRIEKESREMEAIRLQQLQKIDQECGMVLERAKKQAETMRADILARAAKEAAGLLDKGKRELLEERARVLADVQGTVVSVIIQLTQKILEREFTEKDQQRLLESLSKQIPTLLS